MLHAYMPGTEPFDLWEGLDRRSAEYRNLKAERSEVFISYVDNDIYMLSSNIAYMCVC